MLYFWSITSPKVFSQYKHIVIQTCFHLCKVWHITRIFYCLLKNFLNYLLAIENILEKCCWLYFREHFTDFQLKLEFNKEFFDKFIRTDSTNYFIVTNNIDFHYFYMTLDTFQVFLFVGWVVLDTDISNSSREYCRLGPRFKSRSGHVYFCKAKARLSPVK